MVTDTRLDAREDFCKSSHGLSAQSDLTVDDLKRLKVKVRNF